MSNISDATRIVILERDSSRHELELHNHEERIQTVEKSQAVMAARFALSGAFGSFIGGGIVALAVALIH
jgi:hypothetical protein